MPLNYSKWDNLELSDDSDIEEHPNVDKRSMIRWKQRDIHEKRELRRLNIEKLNSELSLNTVLRSRIQAVITGLNDKGIDHYRAVRRRIHEQPDDDKPATGAPNQPTYDMMLGQLLGDIWREAACLVDGKATVENGVVLQGGKVLDRNTDEPSWSTGEIPDVKRELMAHALNERLLYHVAELDKRDLDVTKEILKEEHEQQKKITSDGIHDAWSSSIVTKPEPSPLDKPKSQEKTKTKTKESIETIEVLNPDATIPAASASGAVSEQDDDDIQPLTAAARDFTDIPLGDFAQSYKFIQHDSSVLSEATHDALLLEAFAAERRGDKALAQRCVHQSLLVNYCRELGRDGVGLFFQRMISRNPKSIGMFNDDFAKTYGRVESRTIELMAESGENEQIQLVAEDPSVEIGFNIPDGPPPVDLRLEGPGTEEMDISQVRAFLQRKWDIFQSFPASFRAALQTEKLEDVNKALAQMTIAQAEATVELLQEGGMLSFSEQGVRDMTK